MIKDDLNNLHVQSENILISPDALKKHLPVSESTFSLIDSARKTISDIIHHRDSHLLVICGPCSIHDVDAAKDYARQLKTLHDELNDSLYIVMRVYFEKPRTTTGWKGLINDPNLNGTFDIDTGLHTARQLLLDIADIGLPVATEALDPISPQYLADLISWSAIGARTTESQTHREMASGLSMPVGFKNGTDGSLSTAINALHAAASSHSFMGINQQGQVAVIKTEGNPDGHVILRGGKHPNYDSVNISLCEKDLQSAKLINSIMIDCSHGNSNKDYTRQPLVVTDIAHQILEGNRSIIGIMLESNLHAGNQPAEQAVEKMKYGVSITDACINWPTTETVLKDLAEKLGPILSKRQPL